MGIKDKKEEQADFVELPSELDALVRRGFTEQFMESKFKSLYGETRKEIKDYIENSDEVQITRSESLQTRYGRILIQVRSDLEVDRDALYEHLQTLSKDQILSILVGANPSFKADNLEKALSTPIFKKVTKTTKKDVFTMTVNSDFKKKCEAEFNGEPIAVAKVSEAEIKVKVDKKQVEKAAKDNAASKAKEAAAKAKAAASKAKKRGGGGGSGPKSAADDLEAILGGE